MTNHKTQPSAALSPSLPILRFHNAGGHHAFHVSPLLCIVSVPKPPLPFSFRHSPRSVTPQATSGHLLSPASPRPLPLSRAVTPPLFTRYRHSHRLQAPREGVAPAEPPVSVTLSLHLSVAWRAAGFTSRGHRCPFSIDTARPLLLDGSDLPPSDLSVSLGLCLCPDLPVSDKPVVPLRAHVGG